MTRLRPWLPGTGLLLPLERLLLMSTAQSGQHQNNQNGQTLFHELPDNLTGSFDGVRPILFTDDKIFLFQRPILEVLIQPLCGFSSFFFLSFFQLGFDKHH